MSTHRTGGLETLQFASDYCGLHLSNKIQMMTDLQSGQFDDLLSQVWTHWVWNSWSQGSSVSSSSCSNFFRQMGHSVSRSSLITLQGRLSMKDRDVGGGGLSANMAENASLFQLPEVTRNLAN